MTEFSLVKIEDIPKRKRGRPPKVQHPVNPILEFPTSHLTEQEAKDLQLGYKILKDILSIPKIKPLLDKPDESCFGLHDYYTIIDQPMWFNEISRKYAFKEYTDLKTVIDDIRLVLENCFKFWGHKHKFIKQAFRVEKLLDKHIKQFPEHLKGLCSLGEFDENNLDTDTENTESSFLTEEYHSKILENLEKKQAEVRDQNTIPDIELHKWESEVLTSKQKLKQIALMPELAEIGHFLRLAQDILCLKDITQYEIERMLLMSKESTTLASIMTCFLCPTAMRGSLYFKPIMIYDVWMNLLNRKLDGWYNAYAKFNDKLQLFLKYGIEPYFWEIVGDHNPLADTEFHALNFTKKACILKALCTTMFHSNKKIEDYFNSLEEPSLRGFPLYEDSKFEYVSLFSPEIRVYRISKTYIDIDSIVETVLPNYIEIKKEEEENKLAGILPLPKATCSKRQKFYLAAANKESLRSLLKIVSKKKKSANAIHNILAQDENEKLTLKGLKAMFNQWQKAIERSSLFIENSVNYWINKEISPDATPQNNGQLENMIQDNDSQTEPVLGKRILKRKFSLEDVESSSNDEKFSEASVSDWEDGNIRRSKRIKRAKSVPRFFDRRFMRFERKNFEDAIFEQNFKIFNINGSQMPKTLSPMTGLPREPKKFNFLTSPMTNRGVRIKKTPIMTAKRSIVSAAVENASKVVTPLNESESKILTIDMKTVSNGQSLPWKTEGRQEVSGNQMSWTIENRYPFPPPVRNLSPSQFYNNCNQKFLLQNTKPLEEQTLDNIPQISISSNGLSDPLNVENSLLSVKQIRIPSAVNETNGQDYNMKQISLPSLRETDIDQSHQTKALGSNFPSHQQILYLPQPPTPNPYNKFINLLPSPPSNQVSITLHSSKFTNSLPLNISNVNCTFSDESLAHCRSAYNYVEGRVKLEPHFGRLEFSIVHPDGGVVPLKGKDHTDLVERQDSNDCHRLFEVIHANSTKTHVK